MQEIRTIATVSHSPLPGLEPEAPMTPDQRLQEALSTLIESGEEPITMAAVKRVTALTPKQLAPFKDVIERAEQDRKDRLEQRREALDRLRQSLYRSGGRPSFETLIEDLLALKAQTLQETTEAYRRGEQSGLANRDGAPEAATQEAYQRGWMDARASWQEALDRERKEGREEAITGLRAQLGEAYEQGIIEGERRSRDPLRQAQENHRRAIEQALNQGLERGRHEASQEIHRLQDVIERLQRQPGPGGDREAVNREISAAYDRGRRDGWDEAWREGALPARTGSGPRPDPDREWALAVLHARHEDTVDVLRQRYRSLTKAFHPDRNPDLGPDLIRNLNRAKDLLGL